MAIFKVNAGMFETLITAYEGNSTRMYSAISLIASMYYSAVDQVHDMAYTETPWTALAADAFETSKAAAYAWVRLMLPVFMYLAQTLRSLSFQLFKASQKHWPSVKKSLECWIEWWKLLDRDSKVAILTTIATVAAIWFLRRQLVKYKVRARIQTYVKKLKKRISAKYSEVRRAINVRSRAAATLLPHILFICVATILSTALPKDAYGMSYPNSHKLKGIEFMMSIPYRFGLITRSILESQQFFIFVAVVLPLVRTWLSAASFGHNYSQPESEGGVPRKLRTLTLLGRLLMYLKSMLTRFVSKKLRSTGSEGVDENKESDHFETTDTSNEYETDKSHTNSDDQLRQSHASEREQIGFTAFPGEFSGDLADSWHGADLKRVQTAIFSAAEALEQKLRHSSNQKVREKAIAKSEDNNASLEEFEFADLSEDDDTIANTANSKRTHTQEQVLKKSNNKSGYRLLHFKNSDVEAIWKSWRLALKRALRDPFTAEHALENEAIASSRRRAIVEWSAYWAVFSIIWMLWQLPICHKVFVTLVDFLPQMSYPAFALWLQTSVTQGARLLTGTRTWFRDIVEADGQLEFNEGNDEDDWFRVRGINDELTQNSTNSESESHSAANKAAGRLRTAVETLLTFRVLPEWLRSTILSLVDEGAIWLLPSLVALFTPGFVTNIVYQLVATVRPAYAATASTFSSLRSELQLRQARARLDTARENLAAAVASVLSKEYVDTIGKQLADFGGFDEVGADPRALALVLERVLANSGIGDASLARQWEESLGISTFANKLRMSLTGVLPSLFSSNASQVGTHREAIFKTPVKSKFKRSNEWDSDRHEESEWKSSDSLLRTVEEFDDALESQSQVDFQTPERPQSMKLLTPGKSGGGMRPSSQRSTPLFRRLTRRFTKGWQQDKSEVDKGKGALKEGEMSDPMELVEQKSPQTSQLSNHPITELHIAPAEQRALAAECALQALQRIFKDLKEETALVKELKLAKQEYTKQLSKARDSYTRSVCWLRYWVAWILILVSMETWANKWIFFASQTMLITTLWLQIGSGTDEVFTLSRVYLDPILDALHNFEEDKEVESLQMAAVDSPYLITQKDSELNEKPIALLDQNENERKRRSATQRRKSQWMTTNDHVSGRGSVESVGAIDEAGHMASRAPKASRRASLSAKLVDILASK